MTRTQRIILTLILLTLILALPPAAAQPARNSTIAGRVIDASTGAPLHRAAVAITPEGRDDMRGEAPSDRDGQFLLRALPAGRYRITASRPGYAITSYGAHHPGAPGRILTLKANENKSGLTIRLTRLGGISGTTIRAAGAPTFRSTVSAYRLRFFRGTQRWEEIGSTTTDDRGMYFIGNLTPGRYLVAASPILHHNEQDTASLQPVPTPTYYPSAITRAAAVPVDLAAGAEAQSIDIAVQSATPVALTVQPQLPAGQESSPAVTYAFVSVQPLDEDSIGRPRFESVSIGRREPFGRFRPGRYQVTGSTDYNGPCFAAREEISLSGGAATLTLPFRPCVQLTGHVRIDGPPIEQITTVGISLGSSGPDASGIASTTARPDGSFVLQRVPPGSWAVAVNPVPAGCYVKSIRLGEADGLKEDVVVDPANRDTLEVVISTRGAGLSGRIRMGVATLILASSQAARSGLAPFHATTGVDEEGRFEFRGLPPGPYKIYAFEDVAPDSWLDPTFFERYPDAGTAQDLQAGENPAIQLDAIPAGKEP